MSAFIVSNLHLSALVDAAADGTGGYTGLGYYWQKQSRSVHATIEDRERVFKMLLLENHKSVNARYGQQDKPRAADRYVASRQRRFSPVQILKAIDCYEYQSCEHEGWKDSEAFAFCQALRSKMIGLLDGYEQADWAIN